MKLTVDFKSDESKAFMGNLRFYQQAFISFIFALSAISALYAGIAELCTNIEWLPKIKALPYHISALFTVILVFVISALLKRFLTEKALAELDKEVVVDLKHISISLIGVSGNGIQTLIGLASLPVTTSLYVIYFIALLIGRIESIGLIQLGEPFISIVKSNEYIIVFVIALERIGKAFSREKESSVKFLSLLKKRINGEPNL